MDSNRAVRHFNCKSKLTIQPEELRHCHDRETQVLVTVYWAIAYRVIHAKYAAERTHDACVFTKHQQAQ